MSKIRTIACFGLALAGLVGVATREARAQAPYYPPYPSFPVWQSPTTITGISPIGGLNTAGATVNNTAFDPWRNASALNGSMRPVNRPVRDAFGNVVGWETGREWTNSITGQIHGDTNTVTANGLGGGHHESHTYRSGSGSGRRFSTAPARTYGSRYGH